MSERRRATTSGWIGDHLAGDQAGGQESEEEVSRGKTAKKRTRRSQRAKWRTIRMTMTEKDLEKDLEKDGKEEESNKDERERNNWPTMPQGRTANLLNFPQKRMKTSRGRILCDRGKKEME